MDGAYPYFGLWECGHREICHNSLEQGKCHRKAMRSEKPTHEVVKTSFQTKEEVGVRRLGDISNRAVGKNQIEADNGVDGETMLISLVGVSYQ